MKRRGTGYVKRYPGRCAAPGLGRIRGYSWHAYDSRRDPLCRRSEVTDRLSLRPVTRSGLETLRLNRTKWFSTQDTTSSSKETLRCAATRREPLQTSRGCPIRATHWRQTESTLPPASPLALADTLGLDYPLQPSPCFALSDVLEPHQCGTSRLTHPNTTFLTGPLRHRLPTHAEQLPKLCLCQA